VPTPQRAFDVWTAQGFILAQWITNAMQRDGEGPSMALAIEGSFALASDSSRYLTGLLGYRFATFYNLS